MTPALIISIVALVVAIFALISALSPSTMATKGRLLALETSLKSVRRQLLVGRLVQPDARPTIRNRELTQLGRDIDGEVPVNEALEIVDGDASLRNFVEREKDTVRDILSD